MKRDQLCDKPKQAFNYCFDIQSCKLWHNYKRFHFVEGSIFKVPYTQKVAFIIFLMPWKQKCSQKAHFLSGGKICIKFNWLLKHAECNKSQNTPSSIGVTCYPDMKSTSYYVLQMDHCYTI